MEKETKILIGAGALVLAYYLYNASKASASVSSNVKTPVSPVVTTPSPLVTTPTSPVTSIKVPDVELGSGFEKAIAKATEKEIAAQNAADEASSIATIIAADNSADKGAIIAAQNAADKAAAELAQISADKGAAISAQIVADNAASKAAYLATQTGDNDAFKADAIAAQIAAEKAAEIAAKAAAIAAQNAADEAATLAAQIERDKLAAEIKAYEEENARQDAMRLANQLAYQAMLQAEAERIATARQKEIDDAAAAVAAAAAEEAARQKAMNDLMYKCPEGLEYFQYGCMPTNMIVEIKAQRGEGLILRDFKNNTTTLVQTCPSEYIKQDINCIPRYSFSPQELMRLDMIEAGMVQTSDGQWYSDAKSAAAAQAIIDSYRNTGPPPSAQSPYSERQKSINDAICSVDVYGFINNPNSSSNGMSLSQYIGQFKVTVNELRTARISCPNSIYSSGRIYGGTPDDYALGYQGY
jgi:hypothetical protein